MPSISRPPAAVRASTVTAPKPKVDHYAAEVLDAQWNYGSGVHQPGRVNAGPSISATLKVPYVDVKPSWKVSTRGHTLTVTVDATSTGKFHSHVVPAPQAVNIPVARPQDLGAMYTIVFKDIHGKKLFSTTFRNMLPA